MADTKISDLTALTGADAATTDVFPVVDVDANTTKKMTRAEMFLNTPPITVAGTLSATDNVTVTKSTNAPLQYEVVNLNTGNSVTSGFKTTVNGTNTTGSFFSWGSGIGTSTLWLTALGTRILADSGMTGGLALAAREASASIRFFAGGIADANQVGVFSSTALTLGTGVNLVMASATTVRLGGYTVATLPAAGTAGRTAYVTDATAPTYLGALTGGGAVVCPVFDNGVAWVSA